MATQTNSEHFFGGLSKILQEKWQVDVRLKAGDSDEASAISAHKLILASISEVFKKMFESDVYPKKKRKRKMFASDEFKTSSDKVETVTFSEMKQEELEALVEFIYSDGSDLSDKGKQHVRALYIAADKYEIMHLRALCRHQLISSLNLSNALDTLELSQIPFDEDLNAAAFNYISKNISSFANSEEFEDFVVTNPKLSVEIMKASLTGTVKRRSCYGSSYCSYCGHWPSHKAHKSPPIKKNY